MIHESALVDEGATVGKGTLIWHWCHVCSGAVLGERCSLGQNVYIANDVVIGSGVKIQNNVSVYDGVILEDDVFCGPSVVFTNVYNPRSGIDRKKEYRTTLIRHGASLGANSTIVCGITVGEYAFVGAGAVVTKSVPNYALVVGVPAEIVGWMSKSGSKLDLPISGVGIARCTETGDKYILNNNRLSLSE